MLAFAFCSFFWTIIDGKTCHCFLLTDHSVLLLNVIVQYAMTAPRKRRPSTYLDTLPSPHVIDSSRPSDTKSRLLTSLPFSCWYCHESICYPFCIINYNIEKFRTDVTKRWTSDCFLPPSLSLPLSLALSTSVSLCLTHFPYVCSSVSDIFFWLSACLFAFFNLLIVSDKLVIWYFWVKSTKKDYIRTKNNVQSVSYLLCTQVIKKILR